MSHFLMTETGRFKQQSSWLLLIIIGYIGVTLVYSFKVPAFEVSDELWHFPMVDYLADSGFRLPVQDPMNIDPWRQEGSQPPLYYLAAAILVAGIDRSDLEQARRINPHSDIGIVRPDGNANMIVRNQLRETRQLDKVLLAVQMVRWFSILLGLGTVLVTYQIGNELFPNQPHVAVAAAGLNAFLPMFLFISASVNNDNLSNLLGNLLTLLIIRLFKAQVPPNWRTYTVFGIVMGCALLAKLNLGFWLPVIGIVLLVNGLRFKSWSTVVIGGGIVAALTAGIAGWWYVRNWQLYSDPTGLNVFLDIVGRRTIYANVAQLWSERFSFTQSFWGFFGGMNVPMSNEIYNLLDAFAAIGLFGAALFVADKLLRREYSYKQWLSLAITVIWPAVTFVSFLRWTAETPASQGRLIFGAISSISIWLVIGWLWWQPKRLQRVTTTIMLGGFAGLAVIAPFAFIAPAYAAPEELFTEAPSIAKFVEPNTGGEVALHDVRISTPEVRPESYVELESSWQIISPVQADWSLFVHLISPEGVIVAQRDIYPGQGRLATSDLEMSYSWKNPIAVWVPQNVYAPAKLSIEIGWYRLDTGERLILPTGSTSLAVGSVELLPRVSELSLPNPTDINFDNQLELIGYDLSNLAPQTEEIIELTLYWRRLQPINTNYTVFAHIVEPQTQLLLAGSDSQPANGDRPMMFWGEDETISDTHQLSIRADALPGIYELEIGVYRQNETGEFSRLRVVASDGGMANDYAYLSRIRINP